MGKFLLHLNFLILVAFNYFNYILNLVGFEFSVLTEFIVCLMSLVYIVLHGGFSKVNTGKYILPLFFLSIIFLSFLFHTHEGSLFKIQVLFVRTIFIIFVIDLFISVGFRLDKRIIAVSGVLISLALIYIASLRGFHLRTSLNILDTDKTTTIIGAIEDSRSLSFVFVYLVLSAYGKRVWSFFGLIILLVGVFLTQTRQTMFAILVIILPYFLLGNGLWSFLKKGLVLVLGFSLLISLLYFVKVDFYELRFIERGGEDLERVYLFNWAYELFKSKPIFGWGFGYTDHAYSYPHNIILEVLAELGIVGLVLFLLALIHRFWAVDGKIRVLILFTFILALVSGNMAQNYLFFLTLFIDRRYFESSSQTKALMFN